MKKINALDAAIGVVFTAIGVYVLWCGYVIVQLWAIVNGA